MLHALAGVTGRKIMPAVAAAELFWHFRHARRWTTPRFFDFLREIRVTIEPLDGHMAVAAVEIGAGGASEEMPDFLIAAHALAPGRILVTNDRVQAARVPKSVTSAEWMRQQG